MAATSKRAGSRPYGVPPSVAMVQGVIAKMKEKTGRTIDEWVKEVKRSGPATEQERAQWLKSEHGLGTNYAGWIAGRSVGKGLEDGDPAAYLRAADRHVEEMYGGAKSALRPIHDELLRVAYSLGSDVKACPCQTIVPLYRHHVFAQIKPSTKTRVDLGLALGDLKKVPARVIDTGGFEKKDRITHRIAIGALEEIDDEVKKWMEVAYEGDRG
ncbi:MAG: DUF4287 domain-containing protein [Gemmatimonadota bacterium]|nr:DUF4287 domain-containing protein [Gemmatimonadota bacterium]